MSPCRSAQPAPVQDMVNLEVRGRQLLLSVHGNGELQAWDLLSQKKVHAESILAEGLLDSTVPLRMATTPCNAGEGHQKSSRSSSAVNILVVFGPRTEASTRDSNYQVSQFAIPQNACLTSSSSGTATFGTKPKIGAEATELLCSFLTHLNVHRSLQKPYLFLLLFHEHCIQSLHQRPQHLLQAAMYSFTSSASGYRLEVVSLGLYSLQGRIEDVLACHDSIWGKQRISHCQAICPPCIAGLLLEQGGESPACWYICKLLLFDLALYILMGCPVPLCT